MSTALTDRLAGRVALITGGARGQGAAHAHRLTREGAAVLVADVLDQEGTRTVEQLLENGYDDTYLHLDVADPASWQAAYDVVDSRFGRLDILVNNAGIVHVTDITDETLDAWNRLLSINLTGAFLGLQTMLPLLRKGTRGAVVNTSSILGPSGGAEYAGYAASKAGLLGLTRCAALELAADGIRGTTTLAPSASCPSGRTAQTNSPRFLLR